MVQLNLLPDVKMQYIQARRRKRLILGSSIIISGFFLILFIMLFIYVRVAQPKHMTDLSNDIAAKTSELQSKEDINKILTVQNQLNSLSGLHDQKNISSRLFDYLEQLTPSDAAISAVNIDFQEHKATIEGNAKEIRVVNKFVDTLKFTSFTVNEEGIEAGNLSCELGSVENSEVDGEEANGLCQAFSQVVLSEFSLNDESNQLVSSQSGVSYKIEFNFDGRIFANIKPPTGQKAVELRVPNIVSTRSATEKPGDLFIPKIEESQ